MFIDRFKFESYVKMSESTPRLKSRKYARAVKTVPIEMGTEKLNNNKNSREI